MSANKQNYSLGAPYISLLRAIAKAEDRSLAGTLRRALVGYAVLRADDNPEIAKAIEDAKAIVWYTCLSF